MHLAFIRQNIDIAAAVAWQGYQDKGRCAILIVSRWGDKVYTYKRIHSSLGYLTPAEFKAQWLQGQAQSHHIH